ncbi:MAG: molybdenum cofactor guanylyltransferase [Ktedonobacteraceae bacterium]|nr:molybdenum cofactor guanylyltransferase [Ktedonobacteraceae bacterium]
MMASSVAGIILCGGSSRRMGRDKALLSIPGREPLTFIAYLTEVLTPFCSEVVLVTRDEDQAVQYTKHLAVQKVNLVRIVNDKVPSAGPLMGLYSGLSTLQVSHALVTAVDMPFVQKDMLAFLLSYPLDEALLVPVVDGVPQVLLAIYPRTILPMLAACLHDGRRDLRSLLEVVPVHYIAETQLRNVDSQLRSFVNINTPDDLTILTLKDLTNT